MTDVNQLRLKAHLLVEGINPAPEALAGVGTEFKEQNHGLFGWDFVNHEHMHVPDDFVLSDGTVVQFRYNPSSPYLMEVRDGARVIVHGGDVKDTLAFISRPRFYEASTANGNVMRRIGQVGGEDCFFVCYQNYCAHFARGEECFFCNLVPTKKTYDSVLSKKEVKDIGEVAAAAFAEGFCNHILLTGGCFNHEAEVSTVSGIVDAIRDALGAGTVPGTILPSATTNEDDLRRYRETGIGAIGYSMEIWDEALYKGICPGKARTTSHDDFFRAVQRAVQIFGEGNVYGVFVMGLEPRGSLLAGVKALSSIGANVVPFVWSPNPGSRLEGHRAPTGDWFTDVALEAAEIVIESGVPSGTANHCYRCDGNSLLHDALRLRGIE
ncbi:MAG: radical SAM protein [Actinobacteria bacterium]|nr:radical SAM protein [Actinomycetota bacterium]